MVPASFRHVAGLLPGRYYYISVGRNSSANGSLAASGCSAASTLTKFFIVSVGTTRELSAAVYVRCSTRTPPHRSPRYSATKRRWQ